MFLSLEFSEEKTPHFRLFQSRSKDCSNCLRMHTEPCIKPKRKPISLLCSLFLIAHTKMVDQHRLNVMWFLICFETAAFFYLLGIERQKWKMLQSRKTSRGPKITIRKYFFFLFVILKLKRICWRCDSGKVHNQVEAKLNCPQNICISAVLQRTKKIHRTNFDAVFSTCSIIKMWVFCAKSVC